MRRWLDAEALAVMLFEWSSRFEFGVRPVRVVIERPIPMPNLPAQTIATQFDTFGALRGAIVARVWGRNLAMVNPAKWKRHFGLGSEKGASLLTARTLYPTAPLKLAKHHNRAEALLLARWGQDTLT